jgi:tight adherence protein C
MLVALLGSLAAFVAFAALVLWAGSLRTAAAEARISGLAPRASRPEDDAFADRVLMPAFGSLGKFIVSLLPHSFVASVSRQLAAAGRPMNTQSFFVVVMLTAIGLPAALIAMVALSGGSMSGVLIFFALITGILGLIMPLFWLRNRVRNRKQAIWRSLPDAFDLVTVCVEAGLGLDAALRQISQKMRGPIADEVALTLHEVSIGRPRREALEDMAHRAQLKELTTFVNSIIQAEQLGTSLGRVLRAQGISLRVQRRQKAEELARKAPVKLVFPLVLFIMPTFFIVTLGPIAVRVVNFLTE